MTPDISNEISSFVDRYSKEELTKIKPREFTKSQMEINQKVDAFINKGLDLDQQLKIWFFLNNRVDAISSSGIKARMDPSAVDSIDQQVNQLTTLSAKIFGEKEAPKEAPRKSSQLIEPSQSQSLKATPQKPAVVQPKIDLNVLQEKVKEREVKAARKNKEAGFMAAREQQAEDLLKSGDIAGAARLGNAKAQNLLGINYIEKCYIIQESFIKSNISIKSPEDQQNQEEFESLAFGFFSDAASQHSPTALTNKGVCQGKGYGTPVDKEEAVKNFTEAYKLGDKGGQYWLAYSLFNGEGVAANPKEALKILKERGKTTNDEESLYVYEPMITELKKKIEESIKKP